MSYRPYYNMYPNPQYFAFLFAKSLFVLKHSCMKTMLMHFFLRGEEGRCITGKTRSHIEQENCWMGGWGSVLFKVALLSSPRPYHLTLMQCSWCVGNDTLTDFHVTFAPRNSPWCGVSLCISTSNFLHFQLLFDLQTTPHPC